jgi:hypothetical protein
VLTTQLLAAGNRAVAAVLQRQVGEIPLESSAPPVLPVNTGSGYPRLVEVDRSPSEWKALDYPPVPTPDSSSSYENWHRVRELTVWLPLEVGTWTLVAEGDYWRRPVKWGRFGMSRTETWLIRAGTMSSAGMAEGVTYIERKPYKTKTFNQEVSKPPGRRRRLAAERYVSAASGRWFTSARQSGAARRVPRLVRFRPGDPADGAEAGKAFGFWKSLPSFQGELSKTLSQPGWQLITGSLIRVWLSDNPVLRASFEASEARRPT